MQLKSLFFSLILISVFSFSYDIVDLQIAVGERNQKKVLSILNSLEYEKLPLEFKCEVILAYTDLYFWGENIPKNDYQELAKKYVDELLEKEQTYWKVYYAAALVYGHYVQKNYLLALFYSSKVFNYAKKSVELGQDQYLAHLLYGILNLETPFGKLELAEKHLLKALELNPNHVYTYVELGKLYEKKKECKKAKEMYEKALKIPGMKIWSYVNKEGKIEARQRLSEVEKRCTSE